MWCCRITLRPYYLLSKIHHPSTISRRGLLTLAIETSCDDTSVAILEKLSKHQVTPLASLHFHERITCDNSRAGGIQPISAVNSHAAQLGSLVQKSLRSLPEVQSQDTSTQAADRISLPDGSIRRRPDFISVTRGPGMRAGLTVGLAMAKGLAVAWQIPIVAVHHMQAHALTPRLAHALKTDTTSEDVEPRFPFLSLLVSGGHTLLMHSTDLTTHQTLASTDDTAIGEALDKIGRDILPASVLGSITDVAYAKYLSEHAFPTTSSFAAYSPPATRGEEHIAPTSQYGWDIKLPLAQTREMRFSFSGIASRVHAIVQKRSEAGEVSDDERLELARQALTTAFNHLASRTIIALENLRSKPEIAPIRTLVVSGGVAANPFLRHVLRQFLDVRGFENINLVFPSPELCTDNAAMIGWCGMEMYEQGWRSGLGVLAIRKWHMDVVGTNRKGNGKIEQMLTDERSGILEVDGWYNVKTRG